MLSAGSKAIPRQMLTASVSLSWVMLHLSLLESTHSIKIKHKIVSWFIFLSFDRFLSRLSGVTSPNGSTLSLLNQCPDQLSKSSFSVPHFVLVIPGLLRGPGAGNAQPVTSFCSQEWRGKARGLLGGCFIPSCCLFPPSSGPAPPQKPSHGLVVEVQTGLKMPSGEGGHHKTIPPPVIPITALSSTIGAMSALPWEFSPCTEDASLPSKPLRSFKVKILGERQRKRVLFYCSFLNYFPPS